jgi:hypothetical protein
MSLFSRGSRGNNRGRDKNTQYVLARREKQEDKIFNPF